VLVRISTHTYICATLNSLGISCDVHERQKVGHATAVNSKACHSVPARWIQDVATGPLHTDMQQGKGYPTIVDRQAVCVLDECDQHEGRMQPIFC